MLVKLGPDRAVIDTGFAVVKHGREVACNQKWIIGFADRTRQHGRD
jgi:hypothetical protein